jgi:uncharacterized integral membrane protein
MQLIFVLLTLLLLAVALFALQNADPVTLRFWPWQVQGSVGVVTLAATAMGAVIGALLGLVTRVRRWRRGRTDRGGPDPRSAPRPSAGEHPPHVPTR